MDHVEEARRLFLEGYNCAQAVFCAFCDETGLDIDTAARMLQLLQILPQLRELEL